MPETRAVHDMGGRENIPDRSGDFPRPAARVGQDPLPAETTCTGQPCSYSANPDGSKHRPPSGPTEGHP